MGGSPLFPPQYSEKAKARDAMLHIVRRDPRLLGVSRTRWTLKAILGICDVWKVHSIAGLNRVLRRLGIRYKRGRCHIHSPDPNYVAKLHNIQVLVTRSPAAPASQVNLFQDEFSFYRQPTVAPAFESVGKRQPTAELSQRSNRRGRVVAELDVRTGRVIYDQAPVISVNVLLQHYVRLCSLYQGATIYLIQDNWPLHFHPRILAALEPQKMTWPLNLPASWTMAPVPKYEQLRLPIQLVPLPTYASWTNPIEKVWRMLRQEELHMHREADDWDELARRVAVFLDRFADGSQDLLRYVGLSDPRQLYRGLAKQLPLPLG